MAARSKLTRRPGVHWQHFTDGLWFVDLADGTRATVEKKGSTWSAYRGGALVAKGLTLHAAKRAAAGGTS